MIPVIYMGEGRFVASSPYHKARAEKLYGHGQQIVIEEVGIERTPESHRHYFARLRELWENLPEWLQDDFLDPEQLRKWALIKGGYCVKRQMTLRTNKEAVEAAALLTQLDRYAICEVQGRLLTVWLAKSQAMRAMGNAEFQRSKSDVLERIERLIASPRPQA